MDQSESVDGVRRSHRGLFGASGAGKFPALMLRTRLFLNLAPFLIILLAV
ncbi:MAG: hypothetical protein JWR69_2077, partial [Pedosphaera sp.]|nr:hypothetical protein [Pedosphaera sp.]